MSTILTDHGFLPLSCLRLIVPPLQLVSAALWEIVKQGAVMYYGLLEEFVSTVLETVPELLTYTERVQLLMGLRAKTRGGSDVLFLTRGQTIKFGHNNKRPALIKYDSAPTVHTKEWFKIIRSFANVVLDLCRNDDFASPLAIQPHLNRISSYIKNQNEEASSSEVKASLTNFIKLVKTLLDDQCQRDIFYQKIFPTVFGPKYDSALQALMRKFLLNLQKLLPVPNLEQVSLWLSLSPSILKECVDFMNQPEPLNTLIQHHKHHGHKVSQASSSPADYCIISSLSFRPPNVDNDKGDTQDKSGLLSVSQDWQRDDLLGSESKEIKEENLMEANSEFMRNVDGSGQQHADDLTEDHGASIEVTLQAFDESESNDDDIDMDKKKLPHLKTGSRTYTKTFKCLVCEKDFGSLSKLKKHKATHSVNFKTKVVQPKPNSADMTKESLPSQTETGSSKFALQEFSDSPEEQICKRSSRAKQCSVCREIFTCSTDLISHMRCHTEQSPYLCSFCGKDFDNYEDYETHQEEQCRVSKQYLQDNPSSKATKSKKERAVVSGGRSQIPVIMDAPANSQATQPCLTCHECGQVFSYYKNFEKHQSKCSKRANSKALQPCTSACSKRVPPRKKQKYTKYFVINGCNFQSSDHTNAESIDETSCKTAATQNAADYADASQAKPRMLKCTMCEKNFSNLPLMIKHYSKSHQVRDSYPCPLCKRTFVKLYELVRHQQNKTLYQCAACKKCFSKSGRQDHEKMHTVSVTPRTCETCGQSFKFLAHLILHQRKHKEQQPNVCSDCGKQFSSKECLRAHMVRHTDGYPCTVCGKIFYRKLYLNWHMYKHTGKEPYLCDTCGKGWPTAALLKLHMSHHTEERPFKCEDCGVCYKRESHLIAHRRAVHIRLRPFTCKICSKAFRINSELKQHMIVHTGERPFMCPRCGKKFKKKCHLRQHSKKACR